MNRVIVSVCAVCVSCSAAQTASEISALDLSEVKIVKIKGGASKVSLTAFDDAPYAAAMKITHKGWSSGWVSSWFYNDCLASSQLKLDGTTLLVNLVSSSWYSVSDCFVAAEINVPSEAIVTIDLDASMLSLTGSFDHIDAAGQALDFNFDGHVNQASLSGKAMKANMRFSHLDGNEKILFSTRALIADFYFGTDAHVNYDISGIANIVNTRLTNYPDAGTKLTVDGNFGIVSIR